MFKDICLFEESTPIFYEYTLGDIIKCRTSDIKGHKYIKIIYDENIYDITICNDLKIDTFNAGEICIDLEKEKIDVLNFNVAINFKFLIKSIYKFINRFIDKETLLQELTLFKDSKVGLEHTEEIVNLITQIDEPSLEDMLLAEEDEQKRITTLLCENPLQKKLAEAMTSLDLMLLITNYIFAPIVPSVSQEEFDQMLNAAILYDNSKENIWRLAMNYNERNLNYDKIDDFFIKSKDVWYIGEYISTINQLNKIEFINKIISTKDKTFITSLLEDPFFSEQFNKTDLEKLKISITTI